VGILCQTFEGCSVVRRRVASELEDGCSGCEWLSGIAEFCDQWVLRRYGSSVYAGGQSRCSHANVGIVEHRWQVDHPNKLVGVLSREVDYSAPHLLLGVGARVRNRRGQIACSARSQGQRVCSAECSRPHSHARRGRVHLVARKMLIWMGYALDARRAPAPLPISQSRRGHGGGFVHGWASRYRRFRR
jgi:hypothetical protein